MEEFSIRPYCEETDFDAFRAFQRDYSQRTDAYQVWGAAPSIPEDALRKSLQNACRATPHPFVVADSQNRPIGVSMVERYVRVAKHHTIHITLWEHPEWTEQVLRRTLRTLLESPVVNMVICRVKGYEKELLDACRKAGLQEVGCIPDYFCYDGAVYPEYTFIARKDTAAL